MTDYINKKILLVYNSDSKLYTKLFGNKFLTLNFNINDETKPTFRYNDPSSLIDNEEADSKLEKGTFYCYMIQLFERHDLGYDSEDKNNENKNFDSTTLMVSY